MLSNPINAANRILQAPGAVVVPGVKQLLTVSSSTQSRSDQKRAARAKVLITVEAGRWLRIWKDPESPVDIQFLNLPQVSDQNLGLVEELTEALLPQCYSRLLNPGWHRTYEVERLTVLQLADRLTRQRLIADLWHSRPSQAPTDRELIRSALGAAR